MSAKLKHEEISFGPWNIKTIKGPILSSALNEKITNELDIPSLPEMVFGDTILTINHCDGFGIAFNAVDALKLVDNKNDKMKVGAAEEWRKYRAEYEFIDEIVNPYDWTYTTDYKGTLVGDPTMTVTETKDRIDLDKLRVREKIFFYQDILLFEDELADHGMATLSVKIRVMKAAFFVLMRYFLRVDGVLLRINDTRLHHEAGTDFILREYSSREKPYKEVQKPTSDPSLLLEQLDLNLEVSNKLQFPEKRS